MNFTSGQPGRREQAIRWVKFNAVGLAGFAVQLGALRFLWLTLGLHYLLATALAVEAAIVHNFAWHQRFTWKSDEGPGLRQGLRRFAQFNFCSGTISIAGNLVLMRWLAGEIRLPYFYVSLISVIACSLANFMLNDRFIFNEAGQDKRVWLAG